jgi:hypothetical protein
MGAHFRPHPEGACARKVRAQPLTIFKDGHRRFGIHVFSGQYRAWCRRVSALETTPDRILVMIPISKKQCNGSDLE